MRRAEKTRPRRLPDQTASFWRKLTSLKKKELRATRGPIGQYESTL